MSESNQKCLETAKNLLKSFQTYESEISKHNELCNKYNKEFQDYSVKLSQWESKKNNQYSLLTNERRFGDGKCIVGGAANCASNFHNDWCSEPNGNGWYQVGCDFSDCGWGLVKITCARNNDKVQSDLNSWISSNPKPLPPSGGTDGKCTECSTCNPPSNINLQCCSQIFEGIKSDKEISIDTIQECIQNLQSNTPIKQKIIKQPPQITNLPKLTSQTLSSTSTKKYIIGGGIFLFLLFIFLISLIIIIIILFI